jgi:drug/metabolite transporter (DMT)-like permease
MSLVLLMIAFVLTGLISVTNKAFVVWNLGDYREVYMLGFYTAPSIFGLLALALRRNLGDGMDRRVGLIMGLGGAFSTLCFLIALQHVAGIVAFPVRNMGNVAATGMVGIIAWKERLSKSQWLGIALSLVAIWLIY